MACHISLHLLALMDEVVEGYASVRFLREKETDRLIFLLIEEIYLHWQCLAVEAGVSEPVLDAVVHIQVQPLDHNRDDIRRLYGNQFVIYVRIGYEQTHVRKGVGI